MFVMETIHKWNSVCDTLAVKTDPGLLLILTLKLFWQYYNMIILILFVRTVQNIFTFVSQTNFLCLIYLTDKFSISLFTNAKY